jgi:hypothetical protein
VVTEITIETSRVLVIKRRQVTRFWCNECGVEVEFVRPEQVNTVLDDTEASSRSPHFTKAADDSQLICIRSLLGATALAKRFISCLRRGSNEKARPRE